jgi:hypothetical protein
LKMHADTGIALLRKAQRWLAASFVAAGLAVALMLGQAWIATPPPHAARPSSVEALTSPLNQPGPPIMKHGELPRCRSGATACQPWERAWPKPPPVGTVVPAPTDQPKK